MKIWGVIGGLCCQCGDDSRKSESRVRARMMNDEEFSLWVRNLRKEVPFPKDLAFVALLLVLLLSFYHPKAETSGRPPTAVQYPVLKVRSPHLQVPNEAPQWYLVIPCCGAPKPPNDLERGRDSFRSKFELEAATARALGCQIPYRKEVGEGFLLLSVATSAARWHSKPAAWRSAGFERGGLERL